MTRKTPEEKADAAKLWSVHYRLLTGVLAGVGPAVNALGVEIKELSLLAAVDAHPYPADLAVELLMPKPTVTVTVKRLEAAGLLRREIDRADLRRHRLLLTTAGRRVMTRGEAIVTSAFEARLARLSINERTKLLALLHKLN